MKRALTHVAASLTLVSAPAGVWPQPTLLGYSVSASARQRALEERFRALVTSASIAALHRPLAERPHPAGTPASAATAAHLRRTLESFGLTVESYDYQAYLSHPGRVRVAMTAPAVRPLSVREPAMDADPTSGHGDLSDGYVAYSASGTAEGEVVYVNYGLPDDYAELERLGVSVHGRIAVARYGHSHRAVKVHTAQSQGAVALVLYSDPADDGFARGPAWPDGYWRGERMLQRGNAKLSWFFHGDPLTPGVAATAGAPRLAPATAPTLPRIPVVALAWGEARHLLAALGGPAAPAHFRGALPFPYRTGPGAAAVRIEVALDDGLRPITNVVASLRGRSLPERTILLGTHHDAWTFGGVDPGTGGAALLEVARVLGDMARGGWRPERTISFAFWDAEEFGLVGSTEYVEQLRDRLREELVVYVNTDMYMKGRFDPGGVASLRRFVLDVARDVPAGEPGARGESVLDGWRRSEWGRAAPAHRPPDVASFTPDLEALGSGADFVPFQDHLGVPTLAVEFIGENGYGFGTYHTNFDSRAYVERVADPGFAQGATLSRVLGTLALRMANAELLPFRFSDYAARLSSAVDAAEGWLRMDGRTAVSNVSVAPLRAALAVVAQRAAAVDESLDRAVAGDGSAHRSFASVNDRVARMEQLLADDDGAPETRWYRHVFYGWNIYSLYDGQPFPGLAEAIRVRDAARVEREVRRIARALERMATALEAVRGELQRGSGT